MEILVAIVILGILATFVVLGMRGIAGRGESAAGATDARTLARAQDAFHLEHGRYGSETELVEGGLLVHQSDLNDIELQGDGTYRVIRVADAGGQPPAQSAPTTSVATTVPAMVTTTTTTSLPVIATTIASTTPPAAQPVAGVTCALRVGDAWSSGGRATLSITNNNASKITAWMVQIERSGFGITLDNSSGQSTSGSSLVAKNVGYNGTVNPGTTVEVTGGAVSGEGLSTGRTFGCTVITPQPRSADVTCSFTLTQAWGTGANGQLTIANGGSIPVSGWTIELQRNASTISLSGASVVTSSPISLTVTNQSWNGSIGASVTVSPTSGSVSGTNLSVGQTFGCAVLSVT